MTIFIVCIGGRKQRRFNGILFSDKMTIESSLLPSPSSSLKIGVIPIPIEKRIPSLGIGHNLYRKRDLPGLNKIFPNKDVNKEKGRVGEDRIKKGVQIHPWTISIN